jgi:glycosyltransferase involved in cell wall biosynthesis
LAIDAICRDGHDVRVLGTATTVRSPLLHHGIRLFAHLRALAALIKGRRKRIEAVYMAIDGGAGIYYQILLISVARILTVPLLLHHHSFSYLTRYRRRAAVLFSLSGSHSAHVALCDRMAALMHEHYKPSGEVVVSSNMALLATENKWQQSRDEAPPAGDLIVGHLSNLSAEKGLSLVLASFRYMADQLPDLKFRLAGSCSDPRGLEDIRSCAGALGEAFEYRGGISPSEVPGFLRSIDLFIFPSRYVNEAEPLVVAEAMLCGARVVALDVGCLRAQVGLNGVVVSEESRWYEALSEELGQLRSRRVVVTQTGAQIPVLHALTRLLESTDTI